MRAIKIIRRPNWQRHIEENAYQADVLSDVRQKYWVEALPQPFAIEFDSQEETAIAEATEAIWGLCVEFLDWFFTDVEDGDVDRRLGILQIRPEYWQAIKNSWDRTEPVEDLSLGARFDLAVTEAGQIKLLEINGDTPLLGAETVYQWNWFVDYQHNHQRGKFPLPSDASQFNEFWERIAGQWRRIVAGYDLKRYGISFLVDENLEEDLEMAMQLIQILRAVEQKDSFGYGAEGFIIQEYIELPAAFGYYYTIGSWVIDGEAAGIIIRGDTSKITGRHCLIIPHIVSDNGLYISD